MTLTLSILKELKELDEYEGTSSKTNSFNSDFKSKEPFSTLSSKRRLKRNFSEFFHEMDEITVNLNQIALKNNPKMRIFLGEQVIEESLIVIQEKFIAEIAIGNKIFVHKPEKRMKKGSGPIEGVIETAQVLFIYLYIYNFCEAIH